ncbi:hypothetical protein AAY81_00840 [Denitrobacterium detoxificans]|nr:hypothetical protein [Denitrobacterium detoxificans]ANE21952.1 hypothetical protein AAY81_00840 [Denitrobacterium detoxificans]
MIVNIGEVATFPNPRADYDQAVKILEEAAEAFAAWQQFDAKGRAMYRQPFLHKLFNELADLIMASSNMLRGLDRDPATTCECEPMVLEKGGLLLLLVDSARVYGAFEELESAHILEYGEKASETRLVQGLRELQEDVCMVIASLGVDDFTTYMQACERRNRWRGRYERA